MNEFQIHFLGIGGQICASSWVASSLREHPEVVCSSKKETCFFYADYVWEQGPPWYRQFFPEELSGKTVGEVCPAYLCSPKAARRIHSLYPEVRLFAVLRRPLDRLKSQIRHLLAIDQLPVDDFDRAVIRYPSIIECSTYAPGLEEYFRLFDQDQILLFRFEDLAADNRSVLEQIYDHIGVDASYVPPRHDERYRSTRALNSPIFQAAERLYRRFSNTVVGQTIASNARKIGIDSALLTRIGERTGSRPKIPFEIPEEQLKARFRPDIRRVESLTGWDLSDWTDEDRR